MIARMGDVAAVASGKVCSGCGRWLHLSRFSPKKQGKLGRAPRCRSCNATRVREEQRARRVVGLCHVIGCEETPTSGIKCETHAAKQREHNARYYEENHEKIRERRARCSEENREKARERLARYRAEKTARTDDELAADWARLRPSGRKRCRRCREELPRESFAIARMEPDGRERVCRSCASVKLLAAALPLWEELDACRCYLCEDSIAHDELNIEHMVARRNGGSDEAWNLRPAHASCNSSKNARPLLDVIATREDVDLNGLRNWDTYDGSTGERLGSFGELLDALA